MSLDQEVVDLFCDEATDCLVQWESICIELSKGESAALYQDLFRMAHNIKGGSRAVGLTVYGDVVHKIEDGITLLRDGKRTLTPNLVAMLLEAQKLLIDWTAVLKLEGSFVPDYEDFLTKYQGEFEGRELEEVQKTEAPLTPVRNTPPPLTKSLSAAAGGNETIRISAQKLDHLIQTIGELSIHQSILWHTKEDLEANAKVFLNSLQLSQKLTKELHDQALSLRMQPLQSVFQRLERNVMDLSRSLQKEVEVQISGSDVELDKTVIEKIVDPLTHIVRNAIDHGIENPEHRQSKGKKTHGTVRVSAVQDSFGIIITVQDDGKGLAAEKILNKAREKGLIRSEDQLKKEDIFNLIFLPGFSTAEKVTDVSGRGVGMDVVRKSLEDLQGSIRIESEIDQGTTFTIHLPTSVSIIDGMLVSLGGQKYVVPVAAIDEVVNTKELKLQRQEKMIQFRDQVIPLQDLGEALSAKKSPGTHVDKKALIICRQGKDRVGFLAERIHGQQQIVIRPLHENINGTFGLMGGTILGNGEPGLIIDLQKLTEHYLQKFSSREVAA